MDKKIKKERIKEIKETIKSLKKEVKKLDKEIKKTIKEKEVLVEEKNREIQLGDYVEISEKAWKSTRQSVKDWLKQNPKKAIIWTILAVWGVWWVTYYILQKDSLWDTIPVIYIPKDEDEDKNYKQDWQPKIPDEWESSEWQEWKQGWSTEGDSKWATSVVPSSPNKWWESYKGSNKNLVERPDAAGKSWAQSAGAKTRVWSSTNATWDSKPEWIQTAVNLQEQIKAKQVNLLGDLQNIYKNRYQNLKDIGLWDAFFGLDKGVELDENPIYLDYDGTINGKIIVNSKWEYQITLDNKKAIAGYTANAIITWNDLFEILTKWFTIWKEIDKAELKAYRAFVEKEEEKRRMYGA